MFRTAEHGGVERARVVQDAPKRTMRVLIADNSSAVRQSLAKLLSHVDNVELVGQVRDVPGAIRAIRELKPEVVILDLHMPGGTGLDVLRSIRKEAQPSKVIALTNYPFAQYRQRYMELGASFFFDKSAEFDQIPQALEQLASAADHQGTGAIGNGQA